MSGLEWLIAGILAGCLTFLVGFTVGRQLPRSRPAPDPTLWTSETHTRYLDTDDEIQPADPRTGPTRTEDPA